MPEKTALQKGVQIRETAGFARPFSAHPSQKNPGIQQVFPDFSISSGRKMPRAKLRSTANREIFVSGEAHGAGILDMYSEHRQRCLARKDPVCGCRIPNLHALKGELFSPFSGGDQSASFSISSTSSPKRARAEFTGSGVDMSTPAILRREMGSVLQPPERNFL